MAVTDRPADWKNMDDFAAGIATNRMPATDALVGADVTVVREDGVETVLRFTGPHAVEWSSDGRGGIDWYEAIEIVDGVFFVDQTFAGTPMSSTVTVLDRRTRRAMVVTSTIADAPVPGEPRVSQTFHAAVIAGAAPTGPVPGPTRDLVGQRALYRYSPNHLYEHVYLSTERYCWQCIVGVQRGHGDVDLTTTWRFAQDLYVFTFREFKIPVAATWIYDWPRRTVGKFFGVNGAGEIDNSPGGAFIIPLGRVDYPAEQPV